MTNKQTIDGVSRKVIEDALAAVSANNDSNWSSRLKDELRALLDKPACVKCNDTGEVDSGGAHPWGEGINITCECKPAAQPQGEVERLRAELAEQGVLLRDLVRDCMASDFNEHWDSFKKAESYLSTSAEPKPRGEVDGNSHAPMQKAESVLIQAVAVTRKDDDEGLRLEWLLEGGIAEIEFPGMVLFAMPEANDLCDEDGSAEIYLSPPSEQPSHSGDANEMVAKVVLPERKQYVHQGLSHTDAKADGWNDCLDEVAKLNGLKP